MKVVVQFSGGKDSLASLIWAIHTYGKQNVKAVFCDTQWEHMLVYPYINQCCELLGVELVTIRGQYSFIDLAKKKGRFPSPKARFCTEWLKVRPFIDWLLEQNYHCVIIQGIRADESESRSKMQPHCTYFKYYIEPYGYDKEGKAKYFTYRKADVLAYNAKYEPEIERPVFDKTAQQVIEDILDANLKPCPLYYYDFGRVGCAPCIQVTHGELYALITHFPDYEQMLIDAEIDVNSTFFPPGYIPSYACSVINVKTRKRIPCAQDVFAYIKTRKAKGLLFKEETSTKSCMTAFNICE